MSNKNAFPSINLPGVNYDKKVVTCGYDINKPLLVKFVTVTMNGKTFEIY